MAFYENISDQLREIEILESMFPGENELYWHDPNLYYNAKEFLHDCEIVSGYQIKSNLKFLCFEINLNISVKMDDSVKEDKATNINQTYFLKVNVTLPGLYPKEQFPLVSVISNDLSRSKQTTLNLNLRNFITKLEFGSMMILDIVIWLQDNAHQYYQDISSQDKHSLTIDVSESFSFMCLYMHHIYNKEKRKNIVCWAEELLLTGFLLPGKPGVVYVEGSTCDIEQYFERLRKLSWKKITCKLKDVCEKKKFTNFQELSFGSQNSKHMDMGKFFTFLKENEIGYIFNCLFGVKS